MGIEFPSSAGPRAGRGGAIDVQEVLNALVTLDLAPPARRQSLRAVTLCC
jgi:hypothetical protein